ncbi:senescence-associated protein, partial [Penicillium alfredii]
GEQSNAYRILLRYDRKSRHRRIKKQRRYERLAATSQFRDTSGRHHARTGRVSTLCRSVDGRTLSGGRSPYLKRAPGRGHTHILPSVEPPSYAPGFNPCGNFSGTSSLKFRGTKGSIGHTFMVCIHTENQNQGDFYPFVLLEISVLHESPLGHLRCCLTDVPPQPNSPPDNVFNPDRPARDLNARRWAVKPSSASLNK